MGRVRLDRGQLTRTIQGESRRVLNLRAQRILNRARILAPVNTGRLRASGRIKRAAFFSFRPKATVIFDVDYAAAVNDGRRAVRITPKRAQALRFVIGGRVVFAKVVNQPARAAKPFLDRAVREELGSVPGWHINNT